MIVEAIIMTTPIYFLYDLAIDVNCTREYSKDFSVVHDSQEEQKEKKKIVFPG